MANACPTRSDGPPRGDRPLVNTTRTPGSRLTSPTLSGAVPTDTIKNREKLIKLEASLNGNKAQVLIDSGASRNYLDTKYAENHGIKVDPQGATHSTIELANDTTAECAGKAKNVKLTVETYKASNRQFDMLALDKYDAILGKPWLYDANLAID